MLLVSVFMITSTKCYRAIDTMMKIPSKELVLIPIKYIGIKAETRPGVDRVKPKVWFKP